MAGTKLGGLRARDTNLELHGKDFYSRIGQLGGSKGHTGGFYRNSEWASACGHVGGLISRRGERINRSRLRRTELDKAYEHLMAVKQKADAERLVVA